MNNEKKIREMVEAMYDHRFVTVNLTNGQAVRGRISGLSDTAFSISRTPLCKNRFKINRVESIQLH